MNRLTTLLGCALLSLCVQQVSAAEGDVNLDPAALSVVPGGAVSLDVVVDTGAQRLGANTFEITYDPTLLTYDSASTPIAPGAYSVIFSNPEPGRVRIVGVDLSAVGLPAGTFTLATVAFTAASTNASAAVALTVETLVNEATAPIGPDTPRPGGGADVTIGEIVTEFYTLDVTNGGNGLVTSNPAGIDCGADCTEDYADGTSVQLTATPDAGFAFEGWTGDCAGEAGGAVFMDQDRACGATFAPLPEWPLTIIPAGDGFGTIRSNPAGIDCGTQCTADFLQGTPVQLIPTPEPGSRFDGWSGAGCSGVVLLTGPLTCTATFNQGAAPQNATPVPTLSFWGLVALSGAMGLLGAFARRRRG